MGRILKFDYCYKNTVCTHCEANFDTGEVLVTNFVEEPLLQAFGNKEATLENLDAFFRSRCFSEERVDSLELCEVLGLDHYDAEGICRKTSGKLIHDCFWINFLDVAEPNIF